MLRRREVPPLKSKKPLIILAAILLVAAVFGIFYTTGHIFVNGKAYAKDASVLDLRGSGIGIEEYEEICASLPDCEILWDIPFQGNFYSQDTAELSFTSLSSEEEAVLHLFSKLSSIDCTGCTDYSLLLRLRETFPDVKLHYTVSIDDTECPENTRTLTVASLSMEDVEKIALLPELTSMDVTGYDDLSVLKAIAQRYPDIALSYNLTVGTETFDRFTKELTLTNADPAELLDLLWHMPRLETLTLTDPVGNADDLITLTETYPDVDMTWSREILGVAVSSSDTEVDLSGTSPLSLRDIRSEMNWFPNAEKLILCDLGFDNDLMAAFREEMRSEYKVVWNVDVGYLTMRTDEIYYMPGKYNLGVTDEQAYNLRYFEDMICIDVGHKPLFNCEWAAYMPKLKYLIIADTYIDDISPLEGHDQLIYLEMFITKVTDLTPLLSCTALQDLNLCYTHADPEPITKMTWLKNLWWAEPPMEEAEFQEYLPDTHLMFLHHSSTGNGWRQLQNYYDMRDILGMHYMWG